MEFGFSPEFLARCSCRVFTFRNLFLQNYLLQLSGQKGIVSVDARRRVQGVEGYELYITQGGAWGASMQAAGFQCWHRYEPIRTDKISVIGNIPAI